MQPHVVVTASDQIRTNVHYLVNIVTDGCRVGNRTRVYGPPRALISISQWQGSNPESAGQPTSRVRHEDYDPGACARRGSSGTYSPWALVSSRWPITWAHQNIQNQDLRPDQMEPEVGQLRSTRTRIRVHRPSTVHSPTSGDTSRRSVSAASTQPQRLLVTRSPTAQEPTADPFRWTFKGYPLQR